MRIKNYFYKLLHKYISLYVFSSDSMVEIDPRSLGLFKEFSNHEKRILYTCALSASLKESSADYIKLKDLKNHDPDFCLLNGNLHYVMDIQAYLEDLHLACGNDTRLIITYYSSLWRPLFKVATFLQFRSKTPECNWISHEDIDNLLYLSGFELIKRDNKILIPFYIPILSNLVNRFLAPLPFLRIFTIVNILIARPIRESKKSSLPSVSIIVPARNEAGNIENVILRLPKIGPDTEIIFVEGHSNDDTWQKIQEVQKKYGHQHKIISAKQDGVGKKDAVRKGFSLATKDIFMILDADLTVSPEDLPKFYQALVNNKGEFINGSRLVYPMEKQAMRFMNMVGNKFFAIAFSFALGQNFKDTLCGTKALFRDNYKKIEAHRYYFGEFDPFGDFDLIFGAARLGLKIVEIPILYKERTYGNTNIRRWKHGMILFSMLIFAARKIKFL